MTTPPRLQTITALAAAVITLVVGADAQAQQAALLEPVQIIGIAHRAGRSIDEAPPTVSVITRGDIERDVSFTLRDLLRYEPGVTIDNSPARFGLGSINIRGLDGNRVQMLLDGIRLPESYRVGSFSNATRNQLDLGLLQRVEIMRGPGSALYGSDALAGVVAFSTIDPRDLLSRRSAQKAAVADLGYAEANHSWQRGLAAAVDFGAAQGLLGYQRADGHATINQGSADLIGTTRTKPNPQDMDRENWLAKLVLPLSAERQVRVTVDRHAEGIDTDVLSLNPQSSRTVSLTGADSALRERVSVDADLAGVASFARLRILLYAQRSMTRDDTSEVRANTTAVCLSAPGTVRCQRDAQFRFQQREDGASVIGEIERAGRWVFGLEAARVHTDEQRDGQQTNLNTGAVTKIVGGEPLPTRDFPRSTTDRIGAFVQDELAVTSRATLIPALRYDRFHVTPQLDSVFVTGNPGRSVVGIGDAAFSPKLGALIRVAEATTFSAQWATGFRAPPATDINIGLSNLPAGYAVVPNPNLRAERSRGFELGVRGRYTHFDVTMTAFDTRYTDLIVSRAPLPCPADPHCVPGATGTFQSQNVTRARISGAEATALARLGGGWSAQGALASTTGTDTSRERPLNSIEPQRATVGLSYERTAFSAAAHVTHARAKTRIDTSAGVLFAPPAYTVVDLTASLRIGTHARLSLGIFNLFDQKYWLWSDVRGVLNPGATIDRYTQPGRNASALLRANW
jgi:hemoglobin/transferrin/lactoferrin receptor protein